MLDGFNIIEIVRTGLAGISRGLDSLNKLGNK
jgi:acetolactate synthase small subunit